MVSWNKLNLNICLQQASFYTDATAETEETSPNLAAEAEAEEPSPNLAAEAEAEETSPNSAAKENKTAVEVEDAESSDDSFEKIPSDVDVPDEAWS